MSAGSSKLLSIAELAADVQSKLDEAEAIAEPFRYLAPHVRETLAIYLLPKLEAR